MNETARQGAHSPNGQFDNAANRFSTQANNLSEQANNLSEQANKFSEQANKASIQASTCRNYIISLFARVNPFLYRLTIQKRWQADSFGEEIVKKAPKKLGF